MSKKKINKKFPGNNVFLNLIAIAVVGVLLVVSTLYFLNIYTRHGQNIIVPDLNGLQADEAEQMLRSKGLSALVIDSIFKLDAVPGAVIDQTPRAGNKVKEGRSIYITIYSYNPQQISIPELVDYSSRQAISLLNSIGFSDIIIEEIPAEYNGLVMSVEYKGRKLLADELIPAGSTIKLIVGKSGYDEFDEFNDDYILSPEGRQTAPGQGNQNIKEEKSGMDDSFF